MKVEDLGLLELLKWPVNLRLSENPITSRGVEARNGEGSELGVQALTSAAATARLRRVYVFEMKEKGKSSALAEALALNLHGPKLNLSACDMGLDVLKALAFALEVSQRLPQSDIHKGLKALEVLDLSQNQLGVASKELLASCLTGSLRHLALGENCLGPTGCKALAMALKSYPNLKILTLERNQLQDEGLEAFVEVQCGHLETLNLSNNGIGDTGAQAL